MSTTIELPGDLASLPRLTEAADAFCDAHAVPDADRFALQVALEEVATNIINHGYGGDTAQTYSIVFDLSTDPRAVIITTRDNAPAYNPLARPELDTSLSLEERDIGGLGVHLVKKLMQDARYERVGAQNVLTLTRHFHEPA